MAPNMSDGNHKVSCSSNFFFFAKMRSLVDEEAFLEWTLSLDDVLNVKGSGFGIVLEELGDIMIE